MKLSKPQQTIANDPARFKCVTAGRRFGKTFLSMREIAYRARHPNREIFYVTTSYRAAKMIMWKPLKNRLLDLRWASKINESELSIQLVNGTTISLKGSEDPNRLRGVSLDYLVIDEAAECHLEELWGEICRPALSDKQGGALFIGTPKGKGNPFYDMWVAAKDTPGWAQFQYTTLEGGFVKPEEIEAARADMSERQFRQEFLATWESYESRVAWAFDRDANIKSLENPDTRVIEVGLDFNRNPIHATISVRLGDDIYVIDEISMYSSDTDELVEEIRNRYPNSKVFVYPDPSGSRKQTSSGGRSDHIILENAGFIVKSPRKHDPVRDRINAINARFRTATGENHLFIDPKCKVTINSMDKHIFKEGTGIPDKDTGFDHAFDALSYHVAYVFPLKRERDFGEQPNKWGVALA